MGLDYDASGRLVRRTKSGATDRWYLWDGDHLLAELDSSFKRVAEYVYDAGVDQPLALVLGDTTPTSMEYLIQDSRGNVIGSRVGASVQQTILYKDWGGRGREGTSANNLSWKGLLAQSQDDVLYFARSRWYDSNTGRFLSEDPLGLDAGLNQYTFANDDPINGWDPSGLGCTEAGRKAGGRTVVINGKELCQLPYVLPAVVIRSGIDFPRYDPLEGWMANGRWSLSDFIGQGPERQIVDEVQTAPETPDVDFPSIPKRSLGCRFTGAVVWGLVGRTVGGLAGAVYGANRGLRWARVGGLAMGLLVGGISGPELAPAGFAVGAGAAIVASTVYGGMQGSRTFGRIGVLVGAGGGAPCL